MSKRKYESEDGDEFVRVVRPKKLDKKPDSSMAWSLILYLGYIDYKGLFKLRGLCKPLAALIKERFCGKYAQWAYVSMLMTQHVVHPCDLTRVCSVYHSVHDFFCFLRMTVSDCLRLQNQVSVTGSRCIQLDMLTRITS